MTEYSSDVESTDSTGSDPVGADETDSELTERAPNTLLNGLIGGVVAVVLSFLPFSTVLGGAVAGYLEGGDSGHGVKVGTIAGLVSFVPIALFVSIVAFFVPVVGGPGPGPGPQLTIWLGLLAVLLLTAIYAVGFSILGGVIGVYLKENR